MCRDSKLSLITVQVLHQQAPKDELLSTAEIGLARQLPLA